MKLPEPVENLLQRFRRKQTEDQGVVMRLRAEIDRLKSEQGTLKEQSVLTAYQVLFTDLSSPISQLLLQLHLSGSERNSLTAADVLVHVKRLVGVLKRHGLTVVGQPDEIQRFDPNLHESLNGHFKPTPQQFVLIRFPGISYQGSFLRKAAVDPVEAE